MLKHLKFLGILAGIVSLSNTVFCDTEIKYDNGTMVRTHRWSESCPECFERYGVRFTPAGNCKVTSAKLYMFTVDGFKGTSILYAHKNNGGVPGTIDATQSFTTSSNGWQTVTFSTQPSYSTDFFIVVALAESDAGYDNTCLGLDGAVNAGGRMIAYDYGMWKNPTETMPEYYTGDFMIRAMVSYVGAEETTELLPGITQLNSITPNPITTQTTISYMLTEKSKVTVTIYDVSGKQVKTFLNEMQSAGRKTLDWNTKDNLGNKVSSGMYFCKLNVNGKAVSTKSLIVL